jgi:hypothetical protein
MRHLRRRADAGQDHRPGERQLDPQQGGDGVHAHAARRLQQRGVARLQPDDRVAEDREHGVEGHRGDRGTGSDAQDGEQQPEQANDGRVEPDGADRVGDALQLRHAG